MPATVTLSTTTLSAAVGASDKEIKVDSTSGMLPGLQLYVEGELMQIISLGIDPWVNVSRGRAGTLGLEHDSGSTIYIGRADQFYSQDPQGAPPSAILVSPYINVRNGSIWFAQGDASPDPQVRRWWQKQSATHSIGPLGVRITEYEPTSST